MTIAEPLDGRIVADSSRVLAGPFSSIILADLGATVIKVETPVPGDDTRRPTMASATLLSPWPRP
jgi:crotonobetainyl-CoA:carnitine CoA-transferase CaiB-like acyl-CoA transferase